MLDNKKKELENILDNRLIKTVFQPIVSLRDGEILGHEALSRITGEGEINSPTTLFEVAKEYNRLWDLELLCRNKAFEAAYEFMKPPYDKKLFLNVSPNIMHDENFKKGLTKEYLKKYNITSHHIIFEITERNIIADMQGFMSTIDHYKSQDYKIAIDDAGAGYSGLNLISDISPNYIKLDMKLIRDIDSDNLKYALVKGMVELSKTSNISMIAEGIETYNELETLVKLGVQFGQGYYLQRPDIYIKEMSTDVLEVLKEMNHKKNYDVSQGVSTIWIENLCTCTDIIKPTETVPHVYELCKSKSNFMGLCVVENEVPVGIVTKENIAYQLSGYYGFTLNQHKQISCIMDKGFLSVDHKTPISIVSSIAMSRANDKLYDFIVVTKDNKYIGTVTVKDLLKKTTELEVTAAKHQNPLTGLPGNMDIEQRISHCITSSASYSVAYFDIDNFKAHNDVYGFGSGDMVIRLLSDILKSHFSNQFVGHVGGDDFVVIVDEHVDKDYFEDARKRFESEVLEFYNENDIQNGYITATNRHGHVEKFPLITLTFVVVNNKDYKFRDELELTEVLAARKKLAKQKLNFCGLSKANY